MPTVILVRHGRSGANHSGVLAGRAPGVKLDETGRAQAVAVAERLAGVPLVAVVSSPLERCRQTAAEIVRRHPGLKVRSDRRLTECEYGEWTGKTLKDLAKDPLWPIVQQHPSGVTFPGGESMREMQQRGVDAVRDHDRSIGERHGPHAVWVAVSHGDVIKAIVADALGMHLDSFQRIVVDTASATVISYTPGRPFLVRLNDGGSDLTALLPPPAKRRKAPSSDAVVGGR
ncbi:MAG TPA: histidine phosphatase family protein [Kribbellaceae bacterium]|nr:histidine phosphatase family protein [Kribbellaceae bacterium]